MKSIRIFLVASILATLTLFNFVAALQGYQSSLHEAEKLFDRQLLQTAKLISNLHVDKTTNNLNQLSELAYQVWHNDQLMAASNNAQVRAITEFLPGYGYANFDGYRWRTLTYFNPSDNNWIIAAERTDLRYILAEDVITKAVLPIVLGIPFVGLLIWLIISRGLKPLKDLSNRLKNKQVTDLTPIETPELKDELKQVVQSINVLIHRLDSALEREKRFTSDAAHELRTPISALKVQLHNLEGDLPTRNESFIQLQYGVERMQHLIEQLLSLYRSTPDEFSSQFTPVNLYLLAQDIIAEQHLLFEARDQTLALEGSDNIIDGDPFTLSTLLQNLLSNANKYTPKGGNILVSVNGTHDQVYLKVEDSGPGIAPSDYNKIFERFQRLNNKSEVADTQGCGLGLTIVKHIADLHHAVLSIAPSSFHSGVAFTLQFNKASSPNEKYR
ncbi:MAG: ATP-binding protein [Porticoccus sp.]